MMRFFVFTAVGWALTISGDNPPQQSIGDNGNSLQVAQLDPGTQPDDGAAAEPAAPAGGEAASADPNQAEDNRLRKFAKTPYALFLDSFNRPGSDDVSASPRGQNGLLAPLKYAEPADGGDPSQSRVAGRKLILGNNSDATPGSHVVLNRNFIYAELIELGGFSVSLRVEEIASPDSPPDPDNYWSGFGVGLTKAALTDPTVNYVQQNADFFLALTKANNLRVYQQGTQVGEDIPLDTPPAGSSPPKIRAKFAFDDFVAGTQVNYQLLSRGGIVGSGSFTWGAEAQNYIGFDGNPGGSVDGSLISLTEALFDKCQKPGWLDDVPRKPGTSLIARWLNLIEKADEIDPDGKMHTKLSESQKRMVRNTLLEIDFDMQSLINGDPAIAERDPNKKPPIVVRPGPKTPLAKTPGIVVDARKKGEPQVIGGGDGGVRGPVNAGNRNRHGTVIHRGKFSGGSRGGRGGSSPRIIVIPPPKRPAPAPAPEPAGTEPVIPEA